MLYQKCIFDFYLIMLSIPGITYDLNQYKQLYFDKKFLY